MRPDHWDCVQHNLHRTEERREWRQPRSRDPHALDRQVGIGDVPAEANVRDIADAALKLVEEYHATPERSRKRRRATFLRLIDLLRRGNVIGRDWHEQLVRAGPRALLTGTA